MARSSVDHGPGRLMAVVGAPLSPALDTQLREMITDLRARPETVSRGALVALIVDLTDSSLQYQFVEPLRLLGVGVATRKGIDIGLAGAMRVIRSSVHRVIGNMRAERLPRVADVLERAYFPAAGPARPDAREP